MKLAPKSAPILDSRAFVRLRQGEFAAAIRGYDEALAVAAELPASLYGRGIAKLRSGDTAGGEADVAAARKLAPKIDEAFAEWGVKP